MTRIALVSSEAIRPRMAGIGIRYLELARRLPATRKGRGADWKLEARREAGGDVSLSVNGDHAGTWQVPGPRLGLGVITGEAQFTAIAWD